jgi:hypothetical protein
MQGWRRRVCQKSLLGAASRRFSARCGGGSKDTAQRAYPLRKTASADALPLPSLFDVLGYLKLALRNDRGAKACLVVLGPGAALSEVASLDRDDSPCGVAATGPMGAIV